MKQQLPIWVIVLCALHWAAYLLMGLVRLPAFLIPLLTLLSIAFIVILWIRGLRHIGQGFPRFMLLAILALSLSDLASTATPKGIADFIEGFKAGYQEGQQAEIIPSPKPLAIGLAPSEPRDPKPQPFLRHMTMREGLCAIASWLLFLFLLDRIARHQERQEAQRISIESLRRKAQELSLRAKLAPHFIFNTLNTLKAQIEQDPGAAAATTDKLARLFRQILEVSDTERIPLRQELSFVEAYLGIEQTRLRDRLQVEIDIPEELESIEIPPLSLQVLVENAVKHGVAPLEQGGWVRIRAKMLEGRLRLEVTDPGTGFSPHQGTGTALETLRHRLRSPEDLAIRSSQDGTQAVMCWPIE